MKYLSVCSGIEAASVAWHRLGWVPVGFSEVDSFASAVLAHRFPDVPNFGDMTAHATWPIRPGEIGILVGGTPCQSFSVAGLRRGLHDPRGGLMLVFLEIAARLRPRWIVWENVPGVLSSNGGRDFGSFVGALGELGYGWSYRVLDAQWCRVDGWRKAVPQRRRRVFVVGHIADAAAAATVLFERQSVSWDRAESGETREKITADAHDRPAVGWWWNGDGCAATLTKQNANGSQRMPDKQNFGAVLQPNGVATSAVVGALTAKGPNGFGAPEVDARHYVVGCDMVVRRLTPLECERLQGFPDGWTDVPYRGRPAADGPRYKALGNSMACNCMAWIGRRIQSFEERGSCYDE